MPMPNRDQEDWWRPRRMLCRHCGRSFTRRPGPDAQLDCGAEACARETVAYVASLGPARDASQTLQDALRREIVPRMQSRKGRWGLLTAREEVIRAEEYL